MHRKFCFVYAHLEEQCHENFDPRFFLSLKHPSWAPD
jgi:hypothetical protein